MRADCAEELPGAPRPVFPLAAHGGRSLELMRAVCELPGRLELPKPCGARPESVTLPCAFQERFDAELRAPLLLNEAGGRELILPLTEPFARTPLLKEAGGRFAESCDWRAAAKLCVLFAPPPKLPAELLPRLPEKLIACDGRREAPAAGVERVTTLRFWTPAEGVAMRPCKLEAPWKLVLVGRALGPPTTLARLNCEALRCVAPRLMAPPPTKLLREVTVTACSLRA